MGGRPFPEISCAICAKPVDLQIDLSANEKGKAVHENWYIKQITSPANPVATIAD